MMDSLIQNILVVDDESEIRTMVQHFLQRLGYFCEPASSAFEALEMIPQMSFDLVVSDIRMKGKDGLELMREVRRSYPDLDFIIMTGHAADYTYGDIIDAGASDFVLKPFGMGELGAKIKRIGKERQILHYLRETVKALSWEAAVNASVATLARALISTMPVADISSLVLKHAKELTVSRMGYVGYINRKSCRRVRGEARDLDSEKSFEAGGQASCIEEDGRLLWTPVLETREPVLFNSLEGDSRVANELKRLEGTPRVRRFLSAPAAIEGIVLGHLVVANSERDYTRKDVALIERLADIYALAIQRKLGDDNNGETNG